MRFEITECPLTGRAGQALPPIRATLRDVYTGYSHAEATKDIKEPRKVKNRFTAHWRIINLNTRTYRNTAWWNQDNQIGILDESETEIKFTWDGQISMSEAGPYYIEFFVVRRPWDESANVPDLAVPDAYIMIGLKASTKTIEISEADDLANTGQR
jgi:hypothetical protein